VADIFSEVDDDVRRDRYEKLWKAYGKYVIAVALIVVLAAAGVAAWRDYQKSQREELGARFAKALDTARGGSAKEAAAAFELIARDTNTGYRALATLQEAAALTRAGDGSAALAAYDRLAADRSIEPLMRDLAALLAALHSVDQAEEADIQRRIDPLLKDSNPWRYSARELQALLALRRGDTAAARQLFVSLTDDIAAPPGIRGRAAELLAALGG